MPPGFGGGLAGAGSSTDLASKRDRRGTALRPDAKPFLPQERGGRDKEKVLQEREGHGKEKAPQEREGRDKEKAPQEQPKRREPTGDGGKCGHVEFARLIFIAGKHVRVAATAFAEAHSHGAECSGN